MTCWFADKFDHECEWRPDGQPDPAHLIPQQRLKQAGIEDVWDPRLVVPSCRLAHHLFDSKARKIAYTDYPPKLLAWVQQHHWFWAGDEKGWRRTHTPA